ncbi:SAM-dependent methyltransferase [Streptosporangium sp. CA-135522]|uniref:SAM-dependent methyltransferase n=1 Tax=Streptosporangium sp. CA-135522 TaxID=3240072 RepID=UPI003D922041
MSLRFHEIAESGHRILNPITEDKLVLLGEVARLRPGTRQLDLACGKAEALCQWALRHGVEGVGIDISEVFLRAAQERAHELGVAGQVRFERGDAGSHRAEPGAFDVVSCIGTTWIGGGLEGTIELMLPALREDGILLIGEPYWITEPPEEAYESFGFGPEAFSSLAGTFDRFEAAGLEVLEMVLADQDSWDRYAAGQWWTLSDWLRANPDDPDAEEMAEFLRRARRSHVEYGRQYLGWGVFVLRRR